VNFTKVLRVYNRNKAGNTLISNYASSI